MRATKRDFAPCERARRSIRGSERRSISIQSEPNSWNAQRPQRPEAPADLIGNAVHAAAVEPLATTSEPGLLYRLMYQVHDSAGRTGATLLTQHFALSDGRTADGNFNSAPTQAHVAPAGTITVQSTLSIYPLTIP